MSSGKLCFRNKPLCSQLRVRRIQSEIVVRFINVWDRIGLTEQNKRVDIQEGGGWTIFILLLHAYLTTPVYFLFIDLKSNGKWQTTEKKNVKNLIRKINVRQYFWRCTLTNPVRYYKFIGRIVQNGLIFYFIDWSLRSKLWQSNTLEGVPSEVSCFYEIYHGRGRCT